MSREPDPQRRRRIVNTASPRHSAPGGKYSRPRSREPFIAIGILGAAALATFLALFITSRPYDPMQATLAPQQDVPPSALSIQPSPKPTPSPRPSATPAATPSTPAQPGGETSSSGVPDDAAIQAEIERRFAGDATLANLDVSATVEAGKVTLVGSVRSRDLKAQVEKTVRLIKGVNGVDNQLVVTESTP